LGLRPPPPLDVDLTLQRFRLWGVDPANLYHAGTLYRVASVGGTLAPYRVRGSGTPARPRIRIEFGGEAGPAVRAAVGREVRQLLGLDFPLADFYTHARTDRILGPLVAPGGGLWGLRPSLAPNLFELLVSAISAQQVNLPFAVATRARLVRRFGQPVTWEGVTAHAFPTPERLAGARVETLRDMQFSTRKGEYIVGLARTIAEGRLDLEALRAAADDEVIAALTALRGLGRWSAEWFLARGLGRLDVCPADDAGVQRAVEGLCFGGRRSDAARVRRRALAWRPYRTLAVHYLLAGFRLDRSARAPAAPAAAGGS
jgi:DNA-3-methyladenine glycosylase II